jgi:hypothetical protein
MNFWETITGSDLTRDWKAFEVRAGALPADYQTAWQKIKFHLSPYSDFTGRNLTPIADGALGLLEEAASDGQDVRGAGRRRRRLLRGTGGWRGSQDLPRPVARAVEQECRAETGRLTWESRT